MRTISLSWLAGLLTAFVPAIAVAQPAADVRQTAVPAVDISAGIPAGTESATTARLRKTLAEPTDIDFQDTPLKKAVDVLQAKFDINIQLDNKAFLDAGVGLESPPKITSHLKAVSLRSALRLILHPLDLDFVVKDEVLLITTREKADAELTTRLYPVDDLLDRSHRHNLDVNPAGDLITSITWTVSPTTWDEVGGPGAIKYLPVIESLIISQTAEVHELVRDLLVGMRKVKALGLPKDQRAAAKDDELFVALYWLDVPNPLPPAGAIAGAGPSSSPDKGPAALSPEALLAVSRALAEDAARAVPKVVEPQSWQANGGRGTIEAVGLGVAVRQTRAVHLQVAEFLRSIAEARKRAKTPAAIQGSMGSVLGGGMF